MAEIFALGASPRGLAALVERSGRLLFIRGKEWEQYVPSSTPQHASEASRAANEASTLGNVGLTGRPNPPRKPQATFRVNPSAAAKRNCGRRWCN